MGFFFVFKIGMVFVLLIFGVCVRKWENIGEIICRIIVKLGCIFIWLGNLIFLWF